MTPIERLWVHDQTDTRLGPGARRAWSALSSRSRSASSPQVEAPIYEDLIADQEKRAVSERGPGDIARLLTSGDTWTIR